VGGLTDLIDDGSTGFLVPPGDSSALAEAIENLVTHPEIGREVAEKARLKFQREFTPEVMGNRYLTLYQSLVRRSGS